MRHIGEVPPGGRHTTAREGAQGPVDEQVEQDQPPVSEQGCEGPITIDCAGCPVRGEACDDCLVSVLLGPPEIDEAATAAIAVLAERGLVPPLRDPRGGSARAG